MLPSEDDPKALYTAHWSYQKRMAAWSHERRLREYMLRQQRHWRWRSGGRLLAPPLNLPMPPPFLPLGDEPWSVRPPHHPGLFADEDLEMLQNAFELNLDPLFPYFY
jgi:hypothetical protein